MDRKELKDRFDKLDDRAKVLVEKYPMVAAAVFLAGFIVGGIVGTLLS